MPARAYTYILASQRNGTIYVGVTNDLSRRHFEHLHNGLNSFTGRHNIKRLVHAEAFDDIDVAIAREKALKKWKREWKLRLIEDTIPEWYDLSEILL